MQKIIKTHIFKILFAMVMALGFISDDLIIFEYICDYSDSGPRFYGFPFVQETNTSWVSSMSGDIYIVGFIGNLLFWTMVFGIITFLVSKVKKKVIKNSISVIGGFILLWSLFISFVHFAAIDWRLKLDHDNFKIDYYQSEIDCERSFIFFKKHH